AEPPCDFCSALPCRPSNINGTVSALRFLFNVTLKRRDLVRALVVTRIVPRLPEVLSVEEAARLLQSAPGMQYKAALGVAYGAGLAVLFHANSVRSHCKR
ncbi:hypothetical protein MTR64_20885, partial [Novosphingobium sp. 2580]|nr:hypothetical protein [Novosphingobium album (ex Hu et al. 2023)]